MYCLGCGGAWFTEVRQIIAPHPPAAGQQAGGSRSRYVYECASCGLVLGGKPKRKKKEA